MRFSAIATALTLCSPAWSQTADVVFGDVRGYVNQIAAYEVLTPLQSHSARPGQERVSSPVLLARSARPAIEAQPSPSLQARAARPEGMGGSMQLSDAQPGKRPFHPRSSWPVATQMPMTPLLARAARPPGMGTWNEAEIAASLE